MNPQRPGKRKSPSRNVVFEVNDDDVSPEHSDSDSDEPEAKIFKPQSAFVESVVNALADLESNSPCEEVVSELPEQNVPEIKNNDDDDIGNSVITCSQKPDNFEVSSTDEKPTLVSVSNNDKVLMDDIDDTSNEVGIDKKVVVEVQEKSKEITLELSEKKVIDERTAQKIALHTENEINDAENISQKVDVTVLTDPHQYIRISFSDEKISELYKFKFLKFLRTFVELEVENDDILNISVKRDNLLDPQDWVVLDATMCLNEHENNPVMPMSTPLKDKTPKKKKKKGKKDKGLFVVDPNPSAAETNICSIYSSKFNIDLSAENEEEEDTVRKSVQTCFNCDGSHALKDCPLPRDFSRISAMRQKFKAQRQVSRYHLEDDQKYSHLVPGKISSQLREALGLKKKQLPFYIYKMRVLGYPPGWLEEAKSVSSNLNMFDADGKNVQQTVKQKHGLDPDKIVDFPGFNTPLETNFHDEFRQHRVPPYSDDYSKQVMLDYFEKQFANDDTPPPTSPVFHAEESVDNEDSITELVKQKEILLEALEDNSTSDIKTDKTNIGTSSEKAVSESIIKSEESVLESQSTLSIVVSETLDDEVNDDCAISPPLNDSICCIKESAFGTPILKSGSPYSTIPKSDNFMKDVSPVINFENLPNSTGKYEQMTNVLQKVRKTMKQRQNCET